MLEDMCQMPIGICMCNSLMSSLQNMVGIASLDERVS
jgi:hypothetical protein